MATTADANKRLRIVSRNLKTASGTTNVPVSVTLLRLETNMNKRDKIKFLKAHENSYVKLVYQFPDGATVEEFGYVYVSQNTSTVSLSGKWIDFDILAVIEVRDKSPVETVGELLAEPDSLTCRLSCAHTNESACYDAPDMTRYGIGTSATGVIESFDTLEQATVSAKAWAQSEPRTAVTIWAINEYGEVLDTIISYCTPFNQNADFGANRGTY